MRVVLYTSIGTFAGDIKRSYLKRLHRRYAHLNGGAPFDDLLPWETNEYVNLWFGTNPHKIVCKYFRSPDKEKILASMQGNG